jgi:ABC-type transport system substrate-binding protein
MRWLALVSVLALVIAACGGDGGTDETTTTAGETTTTADGGTTTSVEPDAGFEGLTLESGGCDYGGKIDSIAATAENEVVFSLCSEDPAFLAKLAFIPFAVQPAEHLEATGGSPLENPIGTGPFMLQDWSRGSEIVYAANQDYWGGAPAFDTLVFRWRDSSTARITELTSGNADMITNLAASDYATIEGDSNLQVLVDENPNVFYVGMNSNFAPFDDVKVRQAIAATVDRQRIIDEVFEGAGEELFSMVPPSFEDVSKDHISDLKAELPAGPKIAFDLW